MSKQAHLRVTTPKSSARPLDRRDELVLAATTERRESTLSPDSVAARIVETLVARGVCTFFGIPGGPIAPVFEALRLNTATELIEVRHESHGAFAAASYYQHTGRVAAVVVTAGPGVTNALTGVASAHAESAPVLIVAGDVAWATHGGLLVQACGPEGLAVEQLYAPVTRAQVRVTNARSAVSQTLSALAAALDPVRPGPSLLVLPLDIATASVDSVSISTVQRARALPPDAKSIARTALELARAERPLVVLGGGCRRHHDAIRALVDALDVPFVTTPGGKGVISEQHPASLRNGGMAASWWARRYVAKGVDVTLVLGTDLDDSSRGPTPYIAEGGFLIHVDRNPAVFNRNLPTALGIASDLESFSAELTDFVKARGTKHGRSAELLREIRSQSPYDEPNFGSDDREPIAPHRALFDLQAAFPNARFISDVGEHMLFCLHYLTNGAPNDFSIHLGLGSMSSGIAGATGVAFADRSRPVVCVCGDGGMHMSGMEILTSKKLGLPIVYAVFNDSRYNMVHHGMKQLFGASESYAVPDVDFAAWARAMGVPSRTIRRGGEITLESMQGLLTEGAPVLLDIRIDPEVRIRGGGRVEALQHMSMLDEKGGG
jgi:acetolactate synthase-1/2/3 large subunit